MMICSGQRDVLDSARLNWKESLYNLVHKALYDILRYAYDIQDGAVLAVLPEYHMRRHERGC